MNVPRYILLRALLLLTLPALHSVPAAAEEQEKSDKAKLNQGNMRTITPRWGLGDRWTVETVNRRLHVRSKPGEDRVVEPIQWHFAVSRFEKSLDSDCFRIEVTCAAGPERQPRTILHVDRESMALRRVTMEIPTLDGFQQVSVGYEFESGQPSPVLGPLTALPIDLPAFLAGGAKGLETFEYTSFHGTAEAKGLDQLGFTERVEQRVAQVPAADVRKLLSGSFEKSLENDLVAKSLDTQPITDVRLASQDLEVRQLWQAGKPWPIYSDNGLTVCRLVSVTRGEKDDVQESNRESTPDSQPTTEVQP